MGNLISKDNKKGRSESSLFHIWWSWGEFQSKLK